jgi:hypothetical protein
VWFTLSDKLITWDICLKRGWYGPGRCSLCKIHDESSSHLFVECSYAAWFFRLVKLELGVKDFWSQSKLEECFKDWIMDSSISQFKGVPCFLIHSIWWAWDSTIFNNKYISVEITVNHIIKMAKKFVVEDKEKPLRCLVILALDLETPWGFFDGSS